MPFGVFLYAFDKGKPRENVGRKGAGPRQIDLEVAQVSEAQKVDLHKTAALPKRKLW